jgi:predicted ATPase/DNA-binding CsgD family transcriptional regulator
MAASVIDRRVGNLPVDVTSFVGRRRELADVKRLLSVARLVTLTGMGGVGKTRLALRAAADSHRGFADGVWLVELAGLKDPALVGQTVAAALGIQDESAGWSARKLSDLLADRTLLLVLDNCEHLLDACAVLADALLRACPGLRMLATSRQPLGIVGEHNVSVPPLSVPAPDRMPSLEGLAQYEAVSLFVERAAAVHPGFILDAGNQVTVTAICRRLDGIPLALELAAGRLRVLSADQLLARLDDRYGLLTGGSRAALPRQQTLRALIDWSFELCSPAERMLWGRLSVFVDGFDLDAAEEVCSDQEIPAAAVLDLLAGLVDKSIVVAAERGGRVRYQLPEILREYGRDRLTEFGQTREFRRRQRDWCRRFIADAEAGWFGPDQAELLARLRLEHGNVRSALTFCLTEPGECPVGLEIASALRFYWLTSGRLNEGQHWLDRLLACDSQPRPIRPKDLYVSGYLAIALSDFATADRVLSDAELLAQQLGDVSGAAYVAQIRGLAAVFKHHPAEAAKLLEQALAGHRDLGDLAAAAYDQAWLALALIMLGDDRRADAHFEECLALTASVGELWVRSLALWALGIEACNRGDQVRATAAEQLSIRLRLPLDSRYLIGLNFDVLAWTATAHRDGERAGRLFGAAQSIMRAVGSSLLSNGPTSVLHDQYEAAARGTLGDRAFTRAFQHGMSLGFDQAVAYALDEPDQPVRMHSVSQRTAPVPGSLTRREREIAELITRGLSNKEIANTLVISQRTAEGHVEHILAKLGFTTRVQIAAWVAEQRITPSSR